MNMTKEIKAELRTLDRAEKKITTDAGRYRKQLGQLAAQTVRLRDRAIKAANQVCARDIQKLNRCDAKSARACERELARIATRRAILQGRLAS